MIGETTTLPYSSTSAAVERTIVFFRDIVFFDCSRPSGLWLVLLAPAPGGMTALLDWRPYDDGWTWVNRVQDRKMCKNQVNRLAGLCFPRCSPGQPASTSMRASACEDHKSRATFQRQQDGDGLSPALCTRQRFSSRARSESHMPGTPYDYCVQQCDGLGGDWAKGGCRRSPAP